MNPHNEPATAETADGPTGWKPEPGDTITGVVVDLDETLSRLSGQPYPLVTLEDAGGHETVVHAFHKVLASELARRRPALGDQLTITYEGKHPDKDYHLYRVRGGRGTGVIDWTAYGGPPADAQLPPAAPLPPGDTDAPPDDGLPQPVAVVSGGPPVEAPPPGDADAPPDDMPF